MTPLRIALAVFAAGLIVLIGWATANASFASSFEAIASDPWGLVTLADLYLGFLVVAAVILWLERPLAAALWIVALLILGNVVSALWLAWRAPRVAAALSAPR